MSPLKKLGVIVGWIIIGAGIVVMTAVSPWIGGTCCIALGMVFLLGVVLSLFGVISK